MKAPPFKYILIILVVAAISWLAAGAVRAQGVSVRAEVDRKSVELGAFVQLQVTIQGAQNVSPIQLPDIPDLESRYVGPSTSITVINGQMQSKQSFRYNLYPTKTGRFEIPALTVMIDGQTYQTEAVHIEVTAGTAPTQAPRSQGGVGQQTLDDRIFVVASVPKNEYFVHEQIPLRIKLYVHELSWRNVRYPQFEHLGLVVEDYQAQQGQEVVDGLRYDVLEFYTRVYATRSGDLALGPVQVQTDLLFKRSGRRSGMSLFGNVFDDEFFGGILGRFEQKTVTVTSEELKIKILPLPDEGRPDDFSGAVGYFEFHASANPREVATGDPVTVRMEVGGTGLLDAVAMPAFPADARWKFYDPQTSVVEGKKTTEQVAIPVKDDVRELPQVRFSYFDTLSRKYKTLTQGSFPVTVEKRKEGEAFAVVGLSAQPEDPGSLPEEPLGQDINFIKEHPGRLRPHNRSLLKGWGFWLGLTLYVLAWLGACVYGLLRRKLDADVRFARRLRAPGYAKKGLQKAKTSLHKGEAKDFYDALFKTLQVYFSHKFHLSPGDVTLARVTELARTHQVPDDVQEQLGVIFDECEQVRYASQAFDQQRMLSSFQQVEGIIVAFEKRS